MTTCLRNQHETASDDFFMASEPKFSPGPQFSHLSEELPRHQLCHFVKGATPNWASEKATGFDGYPPVS